MALSIRVLSFWISLSFVVTSFATAQIPTDGLVAYFPFNGNANDESGNGNNGTVFGATLTADRFGNEQSAFNFDGINDYINFGSDLSTLILGNMSISIWVEIRTYPNVGTFHPILLRGEWGETEAVNQPYHVYIYNFGSETNYGVGHEWGQGNDAGGNSASPVLTGWTHLVIVRNSTTNEYAFYINGDFNSLFNYAVDPSGGQDGSGFIGWHPGGITQFLDGKVDDIRLFSDVLTEQEILALYNEGSSDPLAQPGVFYGSTGSSEPDYPGYLLTIDPMTGAGALVGPTGIVGDGGPSVRALAIKSTGEMYAMSHTSSSDLYTVNASTGAGTLVANTGLLHPGDICFDAEDILYGVDDTNILYTVDVATGTRTVVGPTGVTLGGLAYDPTDGTMYGSGASDDIYTIDLATGIATLVGLTGLGGNTPDIQFDQAGNLFGVKRGASGVYDYIAIDKATGEGSIVGSTGFNAVVGLATRLEPPPAIPCADIINFQTRCRAGGTIQARLTLANTDYTGETVEFSIDDVPYQVTVGPNGRANLSIGIFAAGFHTVGVTEPAGCLDPITVRCPMGVPMEGDDLWEEELSWEIPSATRLIGNYPNPFNPSTTFRYGLSEPGQVSLRVYNMLGQVVRTIVDGHQLEGYHEAMWDGRNEAGATVASGLYIYRMTTGGYVETKRMLLLK